MGDKKLFDLRQPASGPFSPIDVSQWYYSSWPLGAHLDGETTTFAVYSKNAEHVLLEIYEKPLGESAKFNFWMQKGSDDIWRAKLAGVANGCFYAFRCWGPNWHLHHQWKRGNSKAGFITDVDELGNRFNPNKILMDPYAREISHGMLPPLVRQAGIGLYMYNSGARQFKKRPAREFDSGPWAPKCVLVSDESSFGEKPYVPAEKTIIYEAHARGLTMHPTSLKLKDILKDFSGFEGVENVPAELRGTYAGAAYMAPYLKGLGFTTIELLPVHETGDSGDPFDMGDDEHEASSYNYWGYMTSCFFAPNRRYAFDKSPGGPTREFKKMVKAFHDHGLEVYLDVVYNHTAEGGLWFDDIKTAMITSFRGLDNSEYYQLLKKKSIKKGLYLYQNDSGCGNNFYGHNKPGKQLILESLDYWTNVMGVDGFRFDLATILARHDQRIKDAALTLQSGEAHLFSIQSDTLRQIADFSAEYDIEIIAEAWDTHTYQVGNFPRGWAEWNGRYRDVVRDFLRGFDCVDDFTKVVNGDYDRFVDQGGPHKSINFITAHDGFTLMDLVSYNDKTNTMSKLTGQGTPEPPFGPSDGGSDFNRSWNSEGFSGLSLHAFRRQRLRNFWTVLMFSRGVPMMPAGDEFGRTMNGNNNPYNIDTMASWLNYDMIKSNQPAQLPGGYHNNYGADKGQSGQNALFKFVQFIVTLRKNRRALMQRTYADFYLDSGQDVTYLFRKPDGESSLQMEDKAVWLLIDGSAIGCCDFLVFINMNWYDVEFKLPKYRTIWRRIIDTAAWAESKNNYWTFDEAKKVTGKQKVHAYSIIVLEQEKQP